MTIEKIVSATLRDKELIARGRPKKWVSKKFFRTFTFANYIYPKLIF